MLLVGLVVGLMGAACLEAWPLSGAYRCSVSGADGGAQTCPPGWVCDDSICCQRDSDLGCPTLPTTSRGCRTGEPQAFYEDRDRDNEGNDRVSQFLCKAPVSGGWVKVAGDCDDNDSLVNSRSAEQCNGKNDNCDPAGRIDEGLMPQATYYRDEDGDGWGSTSASVSACVAPVGYVAQSGDCGPFAPSRNPSALELCNGIDDDCDGVSDRSETGFADVDEGSSSKFPCLSSGLGVCRPGTFRCEGLSDGGVARVCQSTITRPPAGTVFDKCDGLDNDCDGLVDEQPDCGGPDDFTANGLLRGARFSANLTTTAQTNGCLKNAMGASTGWNETTDVWTDNGSSYNLWFVEAPGSTVWDLTRQNLKLRLRLNVSGTSNALAFGNADSFRNPVIYLCGDQTGELIRYVAGKPDAGGVALEDRPAFFDQTFLLSFDQPKWFAGRGSGFDTARVRRVEVLIHSNAPPWSVTIDPVSGFVP